MEGAEHRDVAAGFQTEYLNFIMNNLIKKIPLYQFARDSVFNFPYWVFCLVGHIPSHIMRNFIYRYVFRMKLGKGVKIYKHLDCYEPSKIVIGDGSIIGNDAFLDGRAGIYIGSNVNFSGWVKVFTRQHDMDDKNFKVVGGPVYIEDRANISSCSIILPDLRIGKGAVVMAGAIVTKSVDDYNIVGGIPAKFVRMRSKELEYDWTKLRAIPFH